LSIFLCRTITHRTHFPICCPLLLCIFIKMASTCLNSIDGPLSMITTPGLHDLWVEMLISLSFLAKFKSLWVRYQLFYLFFATCFWWSLYPSYLISVCRVLLFCTLFSAILNPILHYFYQFLLHCLLCLANSSFSVLFPDTNAIHFRCKPSIFF